VFPLPEWNTTLMIGTELVLSFLPIYPSFPLTANRPP